jgi:hypothetical protein
MHPPSEVQQIPVAGHDVAEHVWPATNRLGNTQFAAVPVAHVPSVAQHAPVCPRLTPALASTHIATIHTRHGNFGRDWSILNPRVV